MPHRESSNPVEPSIESELAILNRLVQQQPVAAPTFRDALERLAASALVGGQRDAEEN